MTTALLQVCGTSTIQRRDIHPGSKLGTNQADGSRLGANRPHGPMLGTNQPHGCRPGQVKPQQQRQSVRLGLKRKMAGGPSSSALGRDSQPCDIFNGDTGVLYAMFPH